MVFAPGASPTYVPLGITSLAEYVRAEVPGCAVRAIDLNIAAWDRLAGSRKEYLAFKEFIHGRGGDFYDRAAYDAHGHAWQEMAGQMDELVAEAKRYIERDSLSDGLGAVLGEFSQRMLAERPEMVGLSVMYPRQVVMSLAIARYIRSLQWSGQIIVGGAMVTAMYAEEMLAACPYIDAVFEGEGEKGLAMLCQGRPYEEIDGLVYRNGGETIRNRRAGAIELEGLPLPMFSDMSLSDYWNPEPVVPVVFSRGCRWRRCRFCAHNFSYGPYRRRDVKRFVGYLAGMQDRGIRHFYFADQYVGADDMKKVADEIIARGLDIRFHFMGRPDNSYTPQILGRLHEAGCRWISWGVESGSQRLLEVCGKGTRVEDVRKIIEDTHRAGISNLLMMIFGLPTGGEEDFEATLDFLDEVGEATDDVTNSSFQLFDGTPFGEHPDEYHLVVTGRDVLFAANGTEVHSARLDHSETGDDGSERPGRGPMEVDRWRRRRRMSGWKSDVEGLCCEHYLLYAGRK